MLILLAATTAAGVAVWKSARSNGGIIDPPVPSNLASLDPAVKSLIERLTSEVRKSPREPQRWHRLGLAYQANEINLLAAECHRQSLALDEDQARVWYHLARTLARHGDLDGAIEAGRACVERTNYAPAFWRLGQSLLAAGDAGGAAAQCERAAQIDPADPVAWLSLARAEVQRGRNDEALGAIDRMLAIHTGQAAGLAGAAYQVRATALGRLGRADEAAAASRRASLEKEEYADEWSSDLVPFLVSYGSRTFLLNQMIDVGRTDEAIALARQLLHERPDDAAVLNKLGAVLGKRRQLDESIALLERAVAIEPNGVEAQLNLGLACTLKAKEFADDRKKLWNDRAMRHAQRAVELAPADAKAHGFMGDLLLQEGRNEQSLAAYREAGRLDGRSAMWPFRVGSVLAYLERWEEAIPVFEEMLVVFPEHADGWLQLGLARLRVGRSADALAAIERARALRPNHPQTEAAWRQLSAAAGAGPLSASTPPASARNQP